MLRNDLSNKAAPVLAFNFENVICSSFKSGRLRTSYNLHTQRINAINNLYWKNFSIYYITFQYPGGKLDKLETKLDDSGCMFNGTIRVNDVPSLLFWLRQQSSAFYYDSDRNRVDALNPFGHLWEERLIGVWSK